jgi:hypothetical protein
MGRSPTFDQQLADTYVGKCILVGITYVDHAGGERKREQMHGTVERATPEGVLIALRGAREGTSWNMPPDLTAISIASPGSYTLRGTGEQIENPDLVATWNIQDPEMP